MPDRLSYLIEDLVEFARRHRMVAAAAFAIVVAAVVVLVVTGRPDPGTDKAQSASPTSSLVMPVEEGRCRRMVSLALGLDPVTAEAMSEADPDQLELVLSSSAVALGSVPAGCHEVASGLVDELAGVIGDDAVTGLRDALPGQAPTTTP